MLKLGFIGAGKMAQAIISGLDKTSLNVFISGRDITKTRKTANNLSVTACTDNCALTRDTDIIILAVKPQILPVILAEISPVLKSNQILVSIAAGFNLSELTDLISIQQPIIRVMPNINAMIQHSTSAIVRNDKVSDETYTLVKKLFTQVGSVYDIDEQDFSTFAALAGSSPAFIYNFIDALARAGVLHGLSKELALQIVTETVASSAELVSKSDKHPQQLSDEVTSPGGSTIAGVVSLEKDRFTYAVIDAITATIEKEKSLKD